MSDISSKKFYTSPDISAHFDMSESTLRKYCQELEKSGWKFSRNGTARIFTDEDKDLFKLFLKLRNESGVSVEQSSDMAVRYLQAADTLTYDVSPNIDKALTEKRQENIIQEMRFYNDKIDEKFERFYDGHNILIDKINQVLDENEDLKKRNKKLENHIEQIEGYFEKIMNEQKKSFFSKLFK